VTLTFRTLLRSNIRTVVDGSDCSPLGITRCASKLLTILGQLLVLFGYKLMQISILLLPRLQLALQRCQLGLEVVVAALHFLIFSFRHVVVEVGDYSTSGHGSNAHSFEIVVGPRCG